MFLFVASAVAGVQGWPCQRLNWAWRNVWSTCSVNSFAPITGATTENSPSIAAGFRYSTTTSGPNAINPQMDNAGQIFLPLGAATMPLTFCTNMIATGTGITAGLRNRCRRAIDSYGALLGQCAAPLAPNHARTPFSHAQLGTGIIPTLPGILGFGDGNPTTAANPHKQNVLALATNARMCLLPNAPSGAVTYAPNSALLPTTNAANNCPGLLGWFTVVYNACGFTNHPALAMTPGNIGNTPGQFSNFIAPQALPNSGSGIVAQTLVVGTVTNNGGAFTGGTMPSAAGGMFCTPNAPGPNSWNPVGPSFRTSRCRKALDQFGRTATRCHLAATVGNADPLRSFATGTVAAAGAQNPFGANNWAPACN